MNKLDSSSDPLHHSASPMLIYHQPAAASQNHNQNQIQNQNHRNNIISSSSSQISFGNMNTMMQSSSSSPPPPPPATGGSFNISKDGGAYDLGELDQALFLYLDGGQDHIHHHSQHQKQMRLHTLNIFPSQPMHEEPSAATSNKGNVKSSGLGCAETKKTSEPSIRLSNPRSHLASSSSSPQPQKAVKREGNRRGTSSSTSDHQQQEGPKTPDPKTLRRLAQNREAARKSRLRKKAYVQQLESSRMRLTQLEQEIQRARSQGFYLGGNAAGFLPGDHHHQGLPAVANINSEAALFDMEYARWLEEHHRVTVELRNAVQDDLPENELRHFVDSCLAHYDQLMCLKNIIAKSDAFHLLSGMWRTPAERCFLWIGGCRPSHLIKVMVREIEEGLTTEQEVVGICGLQQTTQEAEEALSQGLEALNHSLSETIISDSLSLPPNMTTYMSQMASAINKLSALEAFLTQADNLRQQTLHRVRQILPTRQTARCFLAMAEYFHRLRALSSLWLGRPRPQ
ncbi:bZIP transcription factor TGA10-like isoform X2 [Andrographis paniculata]|uniref:bZIP transcription factor TGA10-like isoform X2 n=1 Tax=Andrographis paniculata TaxID=175694 RepID=UPI0021E8A6B7|nr:bZIP transcription factor TGA10-like isoform X2 [Andrographis paniculata]